MTDTSIHRHPIALIVDDHEIFRAGFSLMLKRKCGFAEVIEATCLEQALEVLGQCEDVTLATFNLGMSGIASPLSLRIVREIFPRLCVAVVTALEIRDDILQALQAGVNGFVVKTWHTDQIARAIQMILDGFVFVPRSVVDLPPAPLLQAVQTAGNARTGAIHLTPRQIEVLKLIRSGKSNKEIARVLALTESTVKVHANGLYRALGVHNRASAATASSRAVPV
jgi:DNA-binding NarL/FixJ family response regulator